MIVSVKTWTAACVATLTLLLGGCTFAGSETAPASDDAPSPDISLPPIDGVFDYQLGGDYDPRQSDSHSPAPRSTDADTDTGADADTVVVRDTESTPLPGAYNVCYVNGFQTQPGTESTWNEGLLLHDPWGEPLTDHDWPDEYILDPTTQDQRRAILDLIGPVIDRCAEDGFAAVEIDNLDTSARFEGIEDDDAHKLAAAYVGRAHSAGLAIAQKNAAEMTETAHDRLGFDFAVTEECAAFDECAAFTDVYGDHVLQIEYPDTLTEAQLSFTEVCNSPDRASLTILRDRNLVPAGEKGHIFGQC